MSELRRGGIRIDSLQGLRALAALLVVVSHQVTYMGVPNEYAWFLGGFGVKLFFIISGFIMITTNYSKFGSWDRSKDFVLRRIIRIAPIYWLITLIFLLKLFGSGESRSFMEIATSFAFLPNFNNEAEMKPILTVGWTLNYEMLFYALFAVAMLMNRKSGVIFVICALLLIVGLGYFIEPSATGENWLIDAFAFWTDMIILYFAVGLAAGLFFMQCYKRGLIMKDSVVGAAVIAVILTLIYCFVVAKVSLAREFESLVCILIFGICAYRNGGDSDHLGSKIIILIGNASYSIYLTHNMVANLVRRFWEKIFNDITSVNLVIIITIVTVVVGIIVYKFVEQPLLKVLHSPNQQKSLMPSKA